MFKLDPIIEAMGQKFAGESLLAISIVRTQKS
jgi:hypothetical protein